MNVSKILLVAILLVSSFSHAQILRGTTAEKMTANAVKATYYYLPEVESYYDVRNKKYIYARDGKWFTASNLPAKYKAYNVSNSRKIVLTDKVAPYRNFRIHKQKYYKTTKTHVVRPGNSGNAPGHNKGKHHNLHKGKHHDNDDDRRHKGKGHGHNDSKHGGKHNKK